MSVTLWHIELSHYNEKARWALDYKRIPHTRRVPVPGLHGIAALVASRGAQRRLPVLALDGRHVGDSTAIIAALEEYQPDPPLYPADPEERARALVLEDWFDEELGPNLRRYVWHHTLPDDDATAAALFTSPSPGRERMLRQGSAAAGLLVRLDYGIDDERAALARDRVVAAMDRLEAELQPSGYLAGDRFSVADLAAAALFTPVIAPPERPYAPAWATPPVQELRDELTARPGGQWVHEMYARHRGERAAPRASAA